MRKRRLYRHAQRQKQRQAPPVMPQGQRFSIPSEFDRGVEQGIAMAMQQHGRLMAEAKRNALVAAQQEPSLLMARRGGYEEGFNAGMQAAQKASAPKNAQFTYTDLERARRRGFEEGQAKAAQQSRGIPDVNEKAIRKKLVDEMLEQCRVIAESNPNMASGVKAVRRQIGKLNR